ncbi:MAG: hypothetical protein WC734_04615 [Patescibacteria group bacterium]|jgi:hypothetical protein
MESLTPHSKSVRLWFFWSGIVATFLYRAIIVLNNYSTTWSNIAWYAGTVGFVIYFAHRFQIAEKRERVIKQYELEQKVAGAQGLSTEDKAAMEYIFGTLRSSKERWNYIFIFVSSAVALVIGVILDIR